MGLAMGAFVAPAMTASWPTLARIFRSLFGFRGSLVAALVAAVVAVLPGQFRGIENVKRHPLPAAARSFGLPVEQPNVEEHLEQMVDALPREPRVGGEGAKGLVTQWRPSLLVGSVVKLPDEASFRGSAASIEGFDR